MDYNVHSNLRVWPTSVFEIEKRHARPGGDNLSPVLARRIGIYLQDHDTDVITYNS